MESEFGFSAGDDYYAGKCVQLMRLVFILFCGRSVLL